jgi:hypothetical protein
VTTAHAFENILVDSANSGLINAVWLVVAIFVILELVVAPKEVPPTAPVAKTSQENKSI